MTLADRFLSFAGGTDSPTYASWARAVAADEALLALVELVPPEKRQPVLLFATARFLGAPEGGAAAFRDWCLDNADTLVPELARRFTQTNDVRRTGPVAAGLALAAVDGPIALLEVGASAGLGLFPDRYDIRVGETRLGDASSAVSVSVEVLTGAQELPDAALPAIAARAGLDLAPVDVGDASAVRWLEVLVPPESMDRVALLRAAVEVARADPPALLAGDAVDGLRDLVALAPAGTTPVVVTAGTLVYLPGLRRQALVDAVAELGVRWVSYEKTGSLEGVQASADVPDALLGTPEAFSTLAVDGVARAVGDAHGTRLHLL